MDLFIIGTNFINGKTKREIVQKKKKKKKGANHFSNFFFLTVIRILFFSSFFFSSDKILCVFPQWLRSIYEINVNNYIKTKLTPVTLAFIVEEGHLHV